MVPCHRVVRSDGTLGGYVGGLDAKRTLLDLEATSSPAPLAGGIVETPEGLELVAVDAEVSAFK